MAKKIEKLINGYSYDLPVWTIATDWRLNASRDQTTEPKSEDLDDVVNLLATRTIGWDTSYSVHVMPELPPDCAVKGDVMSFNEIAQVRRDVLAEFKAKAANEDAYNARYRALEAMWCVDGVVMTPFVYNNDVFRRITSLRRANEIRFRNNLPVITVLPCRVVQYATDLERMEANAAENTVGKLGSKSIGIDGEMILAYRMYCDPNVKPVHFRPSKNKDGVAQESIFGTKGQAFELLMRCYAVMRQYERPGSTTLIKRFGLPKEDAMALPWSRFNNTNLTTLASEVSGLTPEMFEERLQSIKIGEGKAVKAVRMSTDVVDGFAKIPNDVTAKAFKATNANDTNVRLYCEQTARSCNVVNAAYVIGQIARMDRLLLAVQPFIDNDANFKKLMSAIESIGVSA